MISGIINVYKEKGYTSHDVVAKLRGILRQKKIGHTGTLDPEAEGVLPVCLGAGTKLCDMLTDTGKTYEAVLLLGQETDTQDTTGRVIHTYPVTVTEEEVSVCIASFAGQYDQIPPMYSALKVQGKKLYELARAGIEVERKPRRVTIYEIQINEIRLPRITMTVSCSKGTYIRTLCHDIGSRLGTGGCMESLRRTRVGEFRIEESLTLAQIEALRDQERLKEHILPVAAAFSDAPAACVTPEAEKLLQNGNPLKTQQLLFQTKGDPVRGRVRIYDTANIFCGIYRWDERKDSYVPEKMFLDRSSVMGG
ncbi:MAG: tRNA pseudouridine(55) synthase TruB [Lachnospiraceae bacterium]|nr:tRNA pseudouridine(55) synthase TruB [Lachnospiraceae bacterium]